MTDSARERIKSSRQKIEKDLLIYRKLTALLEEGLKKLQDGCPHTETTKVESPEETIIKCSDCGYMIIWWGK